MQALLKNSNDTKFQANKLFAQAQYSEAISSYDRALASCPNYLEYNIALLRSNIAACHLKLEDWKSAVESATAALDGLDREYPQWSGTIKKRKADQKEREMKEKLENSGDEQSSLLNAKNPIQAVAQVDEQVVEITDETEGGEQRTLEELQKADELRNDVLRIRAKALLRRARARSELDGWANLQGAIEDYTELKELDNLPRSDMKTVEMGLRTLPPRVTAARDKEMGEMMGKLKDVSTSSFICRSISCFAHLCCMHL